MCRHVLHSIRKEIVCSRIEIDRCRRHQQYRFLADQYGIQINDGPAIALPDHHRRVTPQLPMRATEPHRFFGDRVVCVTRPSYRCAIHYVSNVAGRGRDCDEGADDGDDADALDPQRTVDFRARRLMIPAPTAYFRVRTLRRDFLALPRTPGPGRGLGVCEGRDDGIRAIDLRSRPFAIVDPWTNSS